MRNFVLVCCILTTLLSFGQGSEKAIDFQINSNGNNNINLGNIDLSTGNFTVEMWLNIFPSTPSPNWNDPSIFSNKDWDNGTNTGLVVNVKSDGAININFKGESGTRVDMDAAPVVVNKGWFHFAATFDRQGEMKAYVNGVLFNSADISTATGTLMGANPWRLGQDGTGNYEPKFNGQIDEVRIWNGVRSATEIRTYMCKKVTGSENNLRGAWNLNEASGNTINDLSPNNNDGTLENGVTGSRILSGAAIGDESAFSYPSDWANTTVSISDANQGSVDVNINSGNPDGCHVYKINSAPVNNSGADLLTNANRYFGVFVAGGSAPQYTATFNYSNYPDANTNETVLEVATRTGNNAFLWTRAINVPNYSFNRLAVGNIGGNREFIWAKNNNTTCNEPTLLTQTTATTNTSTIDWQTGGATHWNTIWGNQGFEPSTGNYTGFTTQKPVVIAGLTDGNYYDFYVQDTCSGTASRWVGPFRFQPVTCQLASNLTVPNVTGSSATLTWDANNADSWLLEWGPFGFPLGVGITATLDTNYYIINGLAQQTSYEFYIYSICGGSQTSAVGPKSFTTILNSVGEKNPVSFSLFPNPTYDGAFTINSTLKIKAIQLINALGQTIPIQLNPNNVVEAGILAKGIYFVTVEFVNGTRSTTKLFK